MPITSELLGARKEPQQETIRPRNFGDDVRNVGGVVGLILDFLGRNSGPDPSALVAPVGLARMRRGLSGAVDRKAAQRFSEGAKKLEGRQDLQPLGKEEFERFVLEPELGSAGKPVISFFNVKLKKLLEEVGKGIPTGETFEFLRKIIEK